MTTSNKRVFYVGVGIALVLIGALTVGFALFKQSASSPVEISAADLEQQRIERMKAEQRRLFDTPATLGLTAEEYATKVEQLAVESDMIVISTECAMDPLIIKMKEGSILKIDNKDSTEHMLAFEDQNFFAVSSGFVREINITEVFGKGEGIYRYRCGNRSLEEAVGIMYVVK